MGEVSIIKDIEPFTDPLPQLLRTGVTDRRPSGRKGSAWQAGRALHGADA